MENKLKTIDSIIDEYKKSQEILDKKLIRKVYTIVISMVLILVGIIIVEFKEYSNEYKEYKIGKNDLGPRDLVWAGIMGTPPRYYESDTKYGQGYKEFETRHIRKALEDANFNLVYRYMSPNRLEFEFERKHPICFYERKWNNPVEYFKKVRPEILSIPFFYSGNETKKIVFRKGDHHRFKKHLDEKGNINLNSLIQDSTLKTELIRKVNYPWPYSISNITYGKKQEDGSIWDIIKPKYQRNIDLVILHTNDQILQMLERKRFDYQFLETLEYDDFEMSRYTRNGIDTLIYDVKTVHGVDDPNLVFHSVACGNHPLVKEAMPIINETIKNIRTYLTWIGGVIAYTKKLNPDSKMEKLLLGKDIEKTDIWYTEQFKNLNISPWSKFRENNKKKDLNPHEIEKLVSTIPPPHKKPMWQLIETYNKNGEKLLLVINQAEQDAIAYQKNDGSSYKRSLIDDSFLKSVTLDKKEKFKDLNLTKNLSLIYTNIILFIKGIPKDESPVLIEFLKYYSQRTNLTKSLLSLTIVNGNPHIIKDVLSLSLQDIRKLELIEVPLRGMEIGKILKKMKYLNELKIDSGERTSPSWGRKELISLFLELPNPLNSLSLVGTDPKEVPIQLPFDVSNHLPFEAIQIFARKKLLMIKNLEMRYFSFEDRVLKLLLESLPLTIEKLSIGSTGLGGGISSLLLEDFLSIRSHNNKLKKLHIDKLRFSIKKNHSLILPSSLEDLTIINSFGLDNKNFERVIFSSNMKLTSLNLSNNKLNDYNLKNIFSSLGENINRIDLSSNGLTGNVFLTLYKENKLSKKYIEYLSLNGNLISDMGMIFLTYCLKWWEVKKIFLNDLKITDESLIFLANSKLPNLMEISLGNNAITKNGINIFLKKHMHKLISLDLSNVVSLDVKTIGNYITNSFKKLFLKGNLLNDHEISLLAAKLPLNLKNLDLSISRMGSQGALSLAQHMPALSYFYFTYRFGEDELGNFFLFQNLSPYLVHFSSFMEKLSYRNALLLLKNFPPNLKILILPALENEKCEILFTALPNSLNRLVFDEDTKSIGKAFENLKSHFPLELFELVLPGNINEKEQKNLINEMQNKFESVNINFRTRVENQSQSLISYLSNDTIDLTGAIDQKYFKNIIFPSRVIFRGIKRTDIPKGFLDSLTLAQLRDLSSLTLKNLSIDSQEFVEFLTKLPPYLLSLEIINSDFPLKDVDRIIKALPSHLTYLNISGNKFGEEGIKKFREFKTKMEEKTQLPFELIE